MSDDIKLELVQEFFDFLINRKIPEKMIINSPKITKDEAFSVIYFLQEHMHLISDRIEKCIICEELYDTWESVSAELCEVCHSYKDY